MCTFCNVTITSIIGYDNRVSERTLFVSLHHLHDLYQSKLYIKWYMFDGHKVSYFHEKITSALKNICFQSVHLSSICLINLGHTFWI